MELLTIVILSLLLVPLVTITTGALRIALGLAFVLFFPGYTLIAALFPRKGSLDGIERLALSFGLSIAVVPLIGLALNYTPWGIRLYPILISLLFFIVVMATITWYRRLRLPPEERFAPRLGLRVASLAHFWASQARWDKILAALLALAILGAIGTLGYAISKPKAGERFTEFYILGVEGKAENYPREVILGQSAKLIVGIVNREQESTAYKIEITVDGERIQDIGPINLNHEEKWEQVVAFIPSKMGPNKKVEFLLYKEASRELYQTLDLWIDVNETSP